MSEADPLSRQAMRAVTDHIRDHGLKVGDTLPSEGQFAAELGVSRPVMREAFQALAALRLIDVGNGRKPRVGAVDGSVIAASLDHAVNTSQITVPEIWDVRRTIELRTAALAAASRTEAEAAEIAHLAEAMAGDLGDMAAMSRHDIAFHEAIARASHNLLFIQIVGSFGPLMSVRCPPPGRPAPLRPSAMRSSSATRPWPPPSPGATRRPPPRPWTPISTPRWATDWARCGRGGGSSAAPTRLAPTCCGR